MTRGGAAALLVVAVVSGACRSDTRRQGAAPATATAPSTAVAAAGTVEASVQTYPVPKGSRPHDVAPAPDGSVWYTAQATGELGRLDPATGTTTQVKLGNGAAPHGVIVGPDGAA